MNDSANKALLPAGLKDILPPDAAHEASVIEGLMAFITSHGYERVRPPLMEFEDGLLSGSGAAMSEQTFRVMDPASRRMLAVRADHTLQMARIATSRLVNRPRPLRLAYAGQVLRVKGSQLNPDRQLIQVGFELIGSDAVSADEEAILLTVEALEGAGVQGLSVDLSLPTLFLAICDAYGLEEEARADFRAVLDHKDIAGVAALGGPAAELLCRLIEAAGPVDDALKALAALDLPQKAESERVRLSAVAGLVRKGAPKLALTLDPVEYRGFEYHTGVSFVVFGRGSRTELARGGRYVVGEGQSSTGATLYIESVLQALPDPERERRVLIPFGAHRAEAAVLRAEGWITVQELDPAVDAEIEAARVGCTHILSGGKPVALKGE